MAVLKPHHLELLRNLVARLGPVPLSEFDGRQLRPLKTNGLVAEYGQSVVPTSEGRRLAGEHDTSSEAVPPATAVAGRLLSRSQEELLRLIIRATEPMLADHLDGRVLRALETRGLVRVDCGWVSATDNGRDHFERHVQKERGLRRRRATAEGGHARAEALLRAVEQLEAAVPRAAEIMIGQMPSHVDDVFAGLRKLARQMESRVET